MRHEATNWTTLIKGPGVVSQSQPTSISSGSSQW